MFLIFFYLYENKYNYVFIYMDIHMYAWIYTEEYLTVMQFYFCPDIFAEPYIPSIARLYGITQ